MTIKTRSIRRFCLATALGLSVSGISVAEETDTDHGRILPDGTVVVPEFRLPPSPYLSDEAKEALPREPVDPQAPMRRALQAGKVGEMRQTVPQHLAPLHERLREMYDVTTREGEIAGIQAYYARPAGGVPEASRDKILLNLPGGGFVMGHAGGTGMTESIPLAGLARAEVVSITYRQAPEATFPAASEDVASVYRELLKTHDPQDIAIFGCSAGGVLAAQSMAWFMEEDLPLPAAIGIFCASAEADWGGDSSHYVRPFQALPPRDDERAYFKGVDTDDPLASPVRSDEILARFPPTLLITATRAQEMSAAINTHRQLTRAGVAADLHLWDGLGHAFFYDPALPESREAFDVMTRFFSEHLGLEQ